MYRLDASGRDLPFFSLGKGEGEGVRKVSNLKGLKRFPRGWRVGLSALKHRSTDDSFSLSCPPLSLRHSCPPSRLIPFRFLFSLLSPSSVVTYCELLREPCRPAEKDLALSLSMRKILCDMKNGADTLAARLVPSRPVSSCLVSTRAAKIASFVVCDNNFYDAHWLSDERWQYCGPRRGKPRCDERGLGRAFHKIPRVICFKRARDM